jgi:hypothetical protein
MKTNLITSFLALTLTIAAAHAADTENRERRLYEFNFNCEFGEDHRDASATEMNEPRDRRECTAAAQVFAWVDPDDWMSTMQTTRNLVNKLAVQCHDELVYADSAILKSERRFVTITGLQGLPAIWVERRDHDRLLDNERDRDFTAFLRLRNRTLRGTCEVRNEPVRRADVIANAQPQ